jgi:hypothetical protein
MEKETLKKLIEEEFERCETISQFKKRVLELVDLYDNDNENHPLPYPVTIQTNEIPDEVPYGEICSCNPKNGGSGVCGCIMGNNMVPNPKKYGYPKSNYTTTTDLEIKIDNNEV